MSAEPLDDGEQLELAAFFAKWRWGCSCVVTDGIREELDDQGRCGFVCETCGTALEFIGEEKGGP